MTTLAFKVAKNNLSRVFILEGRARPDHAVTYQGCTMAGPIDQALGDIENIKCPSPTRFGGFDIVGEIQGELGRPTTSLTSLYALDLVTTLERLKRLRCPFDIHVNFGDCSDPTAQGTFEKKVILEAAGMTNYSTEDLGTLSDADNAQINESADMSMRDFFSIVPLTVQELGADVVTNPLEDVVICSNIACGSDCSDEDDGCDVIYAVGDSSPGSPGTAPDVIYSTDRAATLAADEITTLTNSENADGIACVGDNVVVVSNDDGGIHYKTKANINAGTAANWTRNATNIAVGGEPNDIWSVGNYAFIVGDGGYIYGIANPASITVLDSGSATSQNLNAVHALNDRFAVAVGAAGAVVRTFDQTTWAAVTVPAAVTLQCVWLINRFVWWVGASNGAVYYTLDGGTTWTAYTNFPVTLTNVEDIAFHNDSVGYIAGQIAGPAGVVLRTYSNGGTPADAWIAMPEGVGNFPASDEVTAIAACVNNPNFMVGVGLADDAADGFYFTGSRAEA